MPQGESRPAVFLCLKTGRKGVISCGLFVLIKWILLTDLVIKGNGGDKDDPKYIFYLSYIQKTQRKPTGSRTK
jgi:hypothetical protein